jgi:copper chaperone CopZ
MDSHFFKITNIDTDNIDFLKQALMDLPGVSDVEVSGDNEHLIVKFDSQLVGINDISETIALTGYML